MLTPGQFPRGCILRPRRVLNGPRPVCKPHTPELRARALQKLGRALFLFGRGHFWTGPDAFFVALPCGLHRAFSAHRFWRGTLRRDGWARLIKATGARRTAGFAMTKMKLIVERHADGYVAYPVGLRGVVVGQGDTFEDAMGDVRSAVQFHIETFGAEAFADEDPVLEAFVAEATVA